MSVRAYKLIEIKTEKDPTFNLNETRITQLESGDDGGVMSFQKDALTEELNEVESELISERDIDAVRELEANKKTLRQMIDECGDEDFVEYYCY